MGLRKVSLVSLGCSKNLVDSEQMLGLIEDNDFEIVENEEDADIMIVNTCAFIESAKKESIDCILELASYKKKDKNKILIVAGCLAQRYKEEVLKEIPEIDAIVGTNEYDKIVEVIKAKDKKVLCTDKPLLCDDVPRILTTPSYTAYLKIAEGCDNFCTYCVIPSIRGRYRSRKMESIVSEAKMMARQGVKELIVIAQDTTRYGIDLYDKYMLPELLKQLCRVDGIKWLRIHYCYPEMVSDELIEVIASEDKICKYMDIPIQHCNDDILKKMGRKTNKEEIVSLIKKLRERIPEVVIRTSLIVGFPGETEEQFLELKDFVENIKFDRLGVFTYSQEEGTPAAKLGNQIEEQEKFDRQGNIMLSQTEISEELNEKKIGTLQRVLVEGVDNIIKNYYGRTYADSVEIDGKVFFKSKTKFNEGDFADVTITDSMEYDLFGEAK